MAAAGKAKDFYKVLGVSEKANGDQIKKSYRKLAKKYHPDANRGDARAADRFKEVGEAYSVLSDAQKRNQYDQMRKLGSFGFDPRAGGPVRSPGAGGMGSTFSFEDFQGGFGNVSDLFSSLFDLGAKGPSGSSRRDRSDRNPRSRRRKGAHVEYVVEISFMTAAKGGKIALDIPISEDCATCAGDGAKLGTEAKNCGECSGSGTISFGQGGFAVKRPCPACLGRGILPETPCTSCSGRGAVRQQRKMSLNVRSGVDTGSKVRLSGKGERGRAGGPPGDLIITYNVKTHDFFKRDGLDVHVSVPINIVQATLGSKISVRTISGARVVLVIPEGTQSGTKFRVRKQGIKKGDRMGDQYVEIVVTVPDQLSEEDRKAMQEFGDASGLKY